MYVGFSSPLSCVSLFDLHKPSKLVMQFVYCYYYRKLSTASSIQYEIDDNISASCTWDIYVFLLTIFFFLFVVFCFEKFATFLLLFFVFAAPFDGRKNEQNNFQGSVGRFDVIVNYVQGAGSNFGQSQLRDREIARCFCIISYWRNWCAIFTSFWLTRTVLEYFNNL